MESKLKLIHSYLFEKGHSEEDLKHYDQHSVYLAMEIMEYAHRNQKRENGEEYVNHPGSCLIRYRKFVGIDNNNPFSTSVDLLYKHNIPFEGVQEVCLLHDVIEDTDLTYEDIEAIYIECGFESFFNLYIAAPLNYITHDKNENYEKYIIKCLKHSTSALVKMIDMIDNLNMLTINQFGEKEYNRANNYLYYCFVINSHFEFVENVRLYKEEFADKKN